MNRQEAQRCFEEMTNRLKELGVEIDRSHNFKSGRYCGGSGLEVMRKDWFLRWSFLRGRVLVILSSDSAKGGGTRDLKICVIQEASNHWSRTIKVINGQDRNLSAGPNGQKVALWIDSTTDQNEVGLDWVDQLVRTFLEH
ncbi:MAG: hypothetical protein V1664_04430 [Candidatus Uhrbacteria bacterium]